MKNGILICETDGTIIDIIDTGGQLREQAGLEHYSGILVPGFVNAHCHLEFSHLKGKIQENKGLGDFLSDINLLRNAEDEVLENAVKHADFELQLAGTVAVGDVSNSLVTMKTKHSGQIYYHTFAETFGFHPSRAEKAYSLAESVETAFRESGLSASITPHSAYSVSEPLFLKIKENAIRDNSILSVHNQESISEAQLFKDGSGPVANHLKKNLGLDFSHWKPNGKSSLEYVLSFIPKKNQLLLVHNTFSTQSDIEILKSQRDSINTFMVLCPNSNLFIENKLPPVPLFQNENLTLCLGTDSLASNKSLSILKEMITLQQHFPEISIQELIEWACLNGARALKKDHIYGSFEKGKKPGINLITGVDLKELKLTAGSKVKHFHKAG